MHRPPPKSREEYIFTDRIFTPTRLEFTLFLRFLYGHSRNGIIMSADAARAKGAAIGRSQR